MPISELVSLFSEELDQNGDSKVIVLLLDDPRSMENVLEAAKQSAFMKDFVWIGMEYEKDSRNTARILQGTLHFFSRIWGRLVMVRYTFFIVFIYNTLFKNMYTAIIIIHCIFTKTKKYRKETAIPAKFITISQ